MKLKQYFTETYTEMRFNVTWPSWKDLQNNTILVVVSSILLAAVIFGMDYVFGITGDSNSFWRGLIGMIYNMF
ncbi:MAG: preprotein translocase subunit SecE [Bacteroidetes bacterium]|nr:preprotein translocase subunit SecE [Bacteroidota bacterium]